MGIRVGHGYDVHLLRMGRRLVLGGVEVPFEKGLKGHSDADVLVHAVMDALLGAGGFGDIGRLFPDTDPRYENISSLLLLKKTGEILREAGWLAQNIDATVIAEAPTLFPYREEMQNNIADALEISRAAVNVKFTTEEKLGFTGAGEGIAAHAVCLISAKVVRNEDL